MTTVGIAAAVHHFTKPPNADGTSVDRLDRVEAKSIFSGETGATTLIPLISALLCIGVLYTKGRVVLGDMGITGEMASKFEEALKSTGATIVKNEGAKTKSLYAAFGGAILGSVVSESLIFGKDGKLSRGVYLGDDPADGKSLIKPQELPKPDRPSVADPVPPQGPGVETPESYQNPENMLPPDLQTFAPPVDPPNVPFPPHDPEDYATPVANPGPPPIAPPPLATDPNWSISGLRLLTVVSQPNEQVAMQP